MRAGIYTRYSTDRQRETSTADQERVARARADALGWTVVAVHADDGVSGSTPVSARPGGAAMLADALADRFDCLILEGLDRLSRDLVEAERIVRRLEHRGIRIVGVSDGYDSQSAARKLHRGMRGIINEVYLDDLRAKTHRGLAGQVGRGLFAGGTPYGYRTVEAQGGRQLEIEPEAARWVLWIYERYAEGWPVRRICHELNRIGVPSPRGSTWSIYAIHGSRAKGTGILNCPLYGGRYIWNRSQWVKDPDTGRRTRRERPRAEWLTVDRPDLRIVPEPLLGAVERRVTARSVDNGGTGRGARPKTLLGGILRCGECGGAVVAVSAHLYGCAAHKDRGPAVCRGIHVGRQHADRRILAEVRDELMSPESLALIQSGLRELLAEAPDTGRRRADLERDIRNLTDAVAAAGWSSALGERLRAAEADLAGLRETPRPASVSAIMANHKRLMADLVTALTGANGDPRTDWRDPVGARRE